MKRMNEKPKKPKDPISKKTDFFGNRTQIITGSY